MFFIVIKVEIMLKMWYYNIETKKGAYRQMDIKEFLDTSYTAFHAVENGIKMLTDAGFFHIDPAKSPKILVGGKYFFTVNSSTLIAFKVGQEKKFYVAESHTDSPSLRLKGNKTIDSPEGKRLNVEKYGGLVLFSLVNTPLKIAGRIIEKTTNGLKEKNVVSSFTVNIPALCIHHNVEVNDKLALSVQKDMLPLVGNVDDIYSSLSDNNVVDGDLFVVPSTPAFISGVNGEYLCSPRIDNLTSVYASLNAIIDSNGDGIQVACCFDNEEIGSLTKQGANSALLENTLRFIMRSIGGTEEDFISAVNNGYILSVDNAHAVHPAHPEKSDPIEKVVMNGGIVIKHHTNYSTDALSSAILKTILDKANIKYQDYYNNSDIRCGGTIGLVTSARLNMKACDIGLAQLAMHSGIETVGLNDIPVMQDCIEAFFSSNLTVHDKEIEITINQ